MRTCLLGHAPHRLCAVCHSTHDTEDLCEECAKDPANEDWLDAHPRSIALDRVEGLPLQRLASVYDPKKARCLGLKERLILTTIHRSKVRERRPYPAPKRNRRRWLWRWRPLTLTEIAVIFGVTQQYVSRVLARTLD